jgi:hypothetical protein
MAGRTIAPENAQSRIRDALLRAFSVVLGVLRGEILLFQDEGLPGTKPTDHEPHKPDRLPGQRQKRSLPLEAVSVVLSDLTTVRL